MADPTPDTPVPDPFEGTSYRAVRRIGEGGMAEVFVVEHRDLGRLFAAKMLHARHAEVPEIVDRMRLEGQTLARVNHPNVVAIQGFETASSGRPFLVVEFLRGDSLTETLRTHGPMPVDLAIHYGIELLSGLAAAHEIGVVHRDVKPDNIFLAESQHRAARELKLIDFGIARVLPGAPPDAPVPLAHPTNTGAVVGTPRFLSPEGARGERVDERADVYGAALVLYTMLAGRGPFDHVQGDQAVMGAHAHETPAPPSQQTKGPVPAELDALLLKALSKDPGARLASAREFKAALEQISAVLPRPAGWLETTTYHRRTPREGTEVVTSDSGAEAAPSATELAKQISELRAAIPEDASRAAPEHSIGGRSVVSRRNAESVSARLSPKALATVVVFAVLALVVSVIGVVGVGLRLRGAR